MIVIMLLLCEDRSRHREVRIQLYSSSDFRAIAQGNPPSILKSLRILASVSASMLARIAVISSCFLVVSGTHSFSAFSLCHCDGGASSNSGTPLAPGWMVCPVDWADNNCCQRSRLISTASGGMLSPWISRAVEAACLF